MNFTPKSEKEIQEANIWPKGEYDFEVVKAERATSGPQSKTPGTKFIKLNLRIFNDEGGFRFVNAILHPAMEAQVRHFCVVGNLMAQYEAGQLTPEDCEGVSGRVKIKVKDAEGNYPAKNEVADYVVPKEKPAAAALSLPRTEEDDSIPF